MEEHLNVREKYSFDELGSDIEEGYKTKKELGENLGDLNGKENFKQIVKSNDGSEKTGELIDQKGQKNCKEGEDRRNAGTGKEAFCGLLLLKKDAVNYRVRATYSENQGKVKVAKKEGEEMSYYRNIDKKGNPLNKEYISFNLLDLNDQNVFGGEELSHPSFINK